jgi:hypothetical protein
LDSIEALPIGYGGIDSGHRGIGRGDAAAEVSSVGLSQVRLELHLIGAAHEYVPIKREGAVRLGRGLNVQRRQNAEVQRDDRRITLSPDKNLWLRAVQLRPPNVAAINIGPVDVLSGVTAIAAGHFETVALIGGVQQQPFLNARPNGNELIPFWPTNAPGFTWQSTLDLIPPVTWIDSTSVPTVIGAYFTLTNTTTRGAQFYGLRRGSKCHASIGQN